MLKRNQVFEVRVVANGRYLHLACGYDDSTPMLLRIALLLVSTVCLRLQSQPKSADTAIRAARQTSNQAIRRHDITSFAETLDADFIAIRGYGGFVASRQAYIDLFTQAFADPQAIRYDRVPDNVELSKAAPLAAEHGHWIGIRPNGRRAYGGTYLAMWRSTKEGWKLRSELFVVLVCDDGPACAGYRKR